MIDRQTRQTKQEKNKQKHFERLKPRISPTRNLNNIYLIHLQTILHSIILYYI